MASNDQPSASGSGTSSNLLEDASPLEQERTRLGRQVISVLNDSETVWKTVSEKQTILHRLYAEQILVSDKFTEFNLTWRDRDEAVSENIDTFHRFNEINEQVQYLLTFLEDFESKLDRSGKIIRDFIRDMRAHLAKLRIELDTVTNAKAVEDMADMDVPNLDWITAIPDPEIEILASEWDQMQLEPRMNVLLQELRTLLHINDDLGDQDMGGDQN